MPHTDEKTEMAMAGRHNVMMFLQDYSATNMCDERINRVHTERLYDEYVEWCGKQPSWIRSVEKRNMMRQLRLALGLESITCSINGQVKRGIELPPRAEFVQLLKSKGVWDELAE